MRGTSSRSINWSTDTRLGKGPHRIVDGQRGIDDAKGEYRTARLTKSHVERDEWSQTECLQDWLMARLWRAMGGNQVGGESWGQLHRGQRRTAGDKAVEHDRHAGGSGANHGACQRRYLQPSDGSEHADRVAGVGVIGRQRPL